MFRVIGVADFNKEFEELKKRGKQGDGESIYLVKIIEKGIEKLKYDYKYGDHISKEKIPKEEIFAISFSDTRLYHDCLIVRLCSDVRVDRERSGSNIVRR